MEFVCSSTTCPLSGVRLATHAAEKLGHRCPACGGPLAAADEEQLATAPPTVPVRDAGWPADLSPSDMPTFLAHAWSALWTEEHPRVRLNWLVDTAELSVRWVTAITLAEVLHQNGGRLPDEVAASIREHIERPTLGRWLAVLRELTQARPATPLVAPKAFDLYAAAIEPGFRSDESAATPSLLVLRNELAHGGGMSRAAAGRLLGIHLPGLEILMRPVVAATADLEVLAVAGARTERLRGLKPEGCARPDSLIGREDGVWLVGKSAALPLLPVARYGPVQAVDEHGALVERSREPAPQVYARSSEGRLWYTPVGRDEARSEELDVARFRSLFGLDAPEGARRTSPDEVEFPWGDMLREARVLAEDLVGRGHELARLKAWLKGRQPRDGDMPRVGWVWGGPGVGKSMLMARVASDYDQPAHRGLFYHRFRGGDARNSRKWFLRLLQEALWGWAPLAALTEAPTAEVGDGKALEDDVQERLEKILSLGPPHPKAPAPSFWVLVDGLDEVAASDPMLPVLLLKMAVPGTVWLLAGRPEAGLRDALAGPACEEVFDTGLPPMNAADIRAMLMEGLGNGRYALLGRDEDSDEGVRNAFIERVVERAGGLPLYVHLLLEDLRSGQLTVHDESRLPAGLTAYYDALVDRLGLSAVKADLTQIVCLLASAQEPLDIDGLAVLLARGTGKAHRFKDRVRAALRAGQALLRRAPSPDTEQGWTLYHQSFRDYVTGGTAASGAGSPLGAMVQDARELLAETADAWPRLIAAEHRPLRNHLFRWGTEYALWWQGSEGVEAARKRLTDFAYLQGRTASLGAWEVTDLSAEYSAVSRRLPSGEAADEFGTWEEFFRGRVHILRRGTDEWPANRILLQLAAEHADDSPVTQAAEAWLETGACDWNWLRNLRRPRKIPGDARARVLEGHEAWVEGARLLDDGQLLSWSGDGTLRLWDVASGECSAVLRQHSGPIRGTVVLADGHLLTWGADRLLKLWDLHSSECVRTLNGVDAPVDGVLLLPDGQLISWSDDRKVRLWDPLVCRAPLVVNDQVGPFDGATLLPNGQVLFWPAERDQHVPCHLCDTNDWRLETIGTRGRFLSTWKDQVLLRCSFEDSHWVVVFDLSSLDYRLDSDLNARVDEMAMLSESIAVLWGRHEVVAWDLATNEREIVKSAYSRSRPMDWRKSVLHVQVIPDRGFVVLESGWGVWGASPERGIWEATPEQAGDADARLGLDESHGGGLLLPHGCVLLWVGDTLRVYDPVAEAFTAELLGHTDLVTGALSLAGGDVVSWSVDGTLRIWQAGERGSQAVDAPRKEAKVSSVVYLSDTEVVSRSAGSSLLSRWNVSTGELIAIFGDRGGCPVGGVRRVSEVRVLCWDIEGHVFLWDLGANCRVMPAGFRDPEGLDFVFDVVDGGAEEAVTLGVSSLRLWSLRTGALLGEVAIGRDRDPGAQKAFGIDPKRVLCVYDDNTMDLWNVRTKSCEGTLRGHSGRVRGILPLPCGRVLSWAEDRTLRLWSLEEHDCRALFEGHAGVPCGALLLANGEVMSWEWEGAVRRWNLETGRCVGSWQHPDQPLRGALARPGHRVLLWSGDGHAGKLCVWDLAANRMAGRWPVRSAFLEAPDEWCAFVASGEVPSSGVLAAAAHKAVVYATAGPRGVQWHGDGWWNVGTVHSIGVISSYCGSQLAFLQLMHGDRRISAEGAQPSRDGGHT